MFMRKGTCYLPYRTFEWIDFPKELPRTISNEAYLNQLNAAADTEQKQKFIKGKITLSEYLEIEKANLK